MAVFEDCCTQGEVAPVLSDVPMRRGPRIPIHVQKNLAHHEWHVDVKPLLGLTVKNTWVASWLTLSKPRASRQANASFMTTVLNSWGNSSSHDMELTINGSRRKHSSTHSGLPYGRDFRSDWYISKARPILAGVSCSNSHNMDRFFPTHLRRIEYLIYPSTL